MLAASTFRERRRMNPAMPAGPEGTVQWIAVAADAVIAAAYFALPAALVYFARRRPDLTLRPMFWLLGTFIVAAGLTNVMDIVTTFWPEYRIENAIKVLTACVGVSTAIAVWPMMPRALALPSTRSLEEVNAFLREENARRRDAERAANEARASLEQRVVERTTELAQSNVKLEMEVQDRLRTEQALRYSETLLRRLHDELEQHITERTEELTRTIDELQAFTYTISHDLRAPLRAINGFAAIMREEEVARLSRDGNALLEKIERNAARMGRLIDGLLEFSRLARAESARDDVDMAALAKSAVAEVAEEYGPRAPDVTFDALPPVRGDAAMLRQTWINLVSNAFKFSSREAAPRVWIGASDGDGEITYHVRDNGVGFDMADAANLFGVFS